MKLCKLFLEAAIQPNLSTIHSNCKRLNPTLKSYMLLAASCMWSGLAKSTLKMYDSAWSYFTSFCASFSVAVLPVNIIIVFTVHCCEVHKMQQYSISPYIHFMLNGLKSKTTRQWYLPLTVLPLALWSLHRLITRNILLHSLFSQRWRAHDTHRIFWSFTWPHYSSCYN